MGVATNADIFARLTLNGSQFSSESARVFGQMEAQARDAAGRAKTAFETSFQNIQQIAQRALAMPRNAGGSLDLNVGAAREAAMAADAQAAALRQVAAAAEATALKTQDASEQTRIYLQAARAAALEAENMARQLTLEANALDVLQAELNQTASATDLVIERNRILNATQDQGVKASRGHAMAMTQAGQQVQDFFIQVGGGQNVLMAATQQLSQLVFVMQTAGGESGKFAKFLSGGWMTAIVGGLTLVGLFGAKFLDLRSAMQKATDELKKQAREAGVAREAQAKWKETTEGLIEASRTLEEQTKHLNESSSEAARRALDEAEALVQKTRQKRDDARATLEQLQAEIQLNMERKRVAGNDPRLGLQDAIDTNERRLAEVQKKIDEIDAAITRAEGGATERSIALIRQQVAEQTDAAARATAKYTTEVERLTEAYRRSKRSAADDAAYRTGMLTAQQTRDREIEAARRAEQRENRDRSRAEREAERSVQLSAPVSARISSGYGERTRPRLTNGGLGSREHYAVDYAVPVGTPVRAGAEGVVVYTGQLGGFGNVVVVDYGKGTMAQFSHLSEILTSRGDVVRAGDTIARSGATGNVTGPHLDYRVKTGVTGIDNGRMMGGSYVDPTKTRVNIGTAGDAQADQERRLEEERKAREDILRASEQQLSVDAETVRFLGLRVRGLEEQAGVESDIAQMRREFASEMGKLSDADRDAQTKVSDELRAQVTLFGEQADAYALLIRAAGDQTQLTQEQKDALDAANQAMLDQLEIARANAKTAGERLAIEEEIARVNARLSTARGQGDDDARDRKRATDELQREWEQAERERQSIQEDNIRTLADFYRDSFYSGGSNIAERFKEEMLDVITEIAARWTLALLSGQKTSMSSILSQMGGTSGVGGGSGSLLSALGLFGGSGGGIAGGSGAAMSGGMGAGMGLSGLGGAGGAASGIMGAVSSAMPYVAAAYMGYQLITSIFGNPFAKPKWGSAGISMQDGQVVGTKGWGKGSDQISGATGAGSSLADGVNRLAEQLGASIKSLPGITIGNWDGKARVALTSTTKPLHSKNFNSSVLKDFGEGGEAEALAYAIKYAFSNAVLDGISQASQTIIRKAKDGDLDAAIEKALMIEDIPKRLAARLDPVGYEIDQFNKQWEKAIAALKEGGASTEQMADAQKLYKLELEETKANAREASATLKEFLAGLSFGTNSPYSLKDQEAMARAALQPFLDKIAAGDSIDQGKFADAAQAFLDLERQLYGSTGQYFDSLEMIQAATGKAISKIDNAVPIRTASDPFAEQTAANTAALAEQTDQTNQLLASLPERIAAAIAAHGIDPSFLSDPRLFKKTGSY